MPGSTSWQVGPFRGDPVRDVLEVEIEAGGRVLHLLDNHWKSKIEGARETEASRLESARVVSRRLRDILAADPRADVVVAGDFNESIDEHARAGGGYRTALVPLGEDIPSGSLAGTIFLSSDSRSVGLLDGRLALYDPWFELGPAQRGSSMFRGEWQTPDHILLSAGLFDPDGFSLPPGQLPGSAPALPSQA